MGITQSNGAGPIRSTHTLVGQQCQKAGKNFEPDFFKRQRNKLCRNYLALKRQKYLQKQQLSQEEKTEFEQNEEAEIQAAILEYESRSQKRNPPDHHHPHLDEQKEQFAWSDSKEGASEHDHNKSIYQFCQYPFYEHEGEQQQQRNSTASEQDQQHSEEAKESSNLTFSRSSITYPRSSNHSQQPVQIDRFSGELSNLMLYLPESRDRLSITENTPLPAASYLREDTAEDNEEAEVDQNTMTHITDATQSTKTLRSQLAESFNQQLPPRISSTSNIQEPFSLPTRTNRTTEYPTEQHLKTQQTEHNQPTQMKGQRIRQRPSNSNGEGDNAESNDIARKDFFDSVLKQIPVFSTSLWRTLSSNSSIFSTASTSMNTANSISQGLIGNDMAESTYLSSYRECGSSDMGMSTQSPPQPSSLNTSPLLPPQIPATSASSVLPTTITTTTTTNTNKEENLFEASENFFRKTRMISRTTTSMYCSLCKDSDFSLLEVLGSGSYGRVEKQLFSAVQQEVAKKIYLDASQVSEFRAEVEFLYEHSANFIPKLLHINEKELTFYLELGFITLEDFFRYIHCNPLASATNSISDSTAVWLIVKLLELNSKFYERQIHHSDIKPANIIVSFDSETSMPCLKFIDFGAASSEIESYWDQFTPLFVSPELLRIYAHTGGLLTREQIFFAECFASCRSIQVLILAGFPAFKRRIKLENIPTFLDDHIIQQKYPNTMILLKKFFADPSNSIDREKYNAIDVEQYTKNIDLLGIVRDFELVYRSIREKKRTSE